MLIDATHKRWIAATAVLALGAVGLYVWLARISPGGRVTASSVPGMWYGIAGSLLMVFAGLLAALRKVPSWWWIGSRQAWLRGHIWLGLLSGLLVLLHSDFRWGGWLTIALSAVVILTLASGVFGLVLQQFLPRMLAERAPFEAPYEQIPHICRVLRRKADALLEKAWATNAQAAAQMSIQASQMGMGARVQLQEFHERHLRPFLAERYPRTAILASPLQAEAAFARLKALPGLADVKDAVVGLEELAAERRQLAAQERLHHWLHGWLLVHIPLSVALLVLGVAHVVWSLYF